MSRFPHFIIAIAIGLILVGAVSLLENAYYIRIIFMMCVYYLCAAGMNVLVGYAGQKSLGQAGLFAAGAYTVAVLTTTYDLNPWVALLAAAFVSMLFGVLIAMPSLRVKGPYLAMVTLAFGMVVERIVTEWTEVFGGAQGIYNIKPLTYFGTPLSDTQMVGVGLVLCVTTHVCLRNLLIGRFGRAFHSLQTDEIAAASVGVNVYKYKVLAFVIAAVTCGVAGALVAHEAQYINSDYISFRLSVFILLLALFGGPGLIYGPLFGAVFLVLIDAMLVRWPAVQHFVYGAMLLFALYLMPRGVAGVFADLLRKIKRHEDIVPEQQAQSGLPQSRFKSAEKVLLQVEQVSKAYGGVKPAQDIDLMLKHGHIHALIGPNGAGKTTLINMITSIVKPDKGRIVFNNREIVGVASADICALGVARTFQNLRLFSDLSVMDNILIGHHCRMANGFWSSLIGLPSARREERRAHDVVKSIIASVGLSGHESRPAGSLPYGLQRRVELARSLATTPQLLLLDEPAAGLNPVETSELGTLLTKIAGTGITILMVEHHMDLVMSISDHVAVLDYGLKISEGTPLQVQSDRAVIAAYLGAEADPDLALAAT